jgi:hypothetical protein
VTILIIASLVVLGALYAGLRRAPLMTVLTVGLIGCAFQFHALRLPSVITAPITRADAALQSWQQRQSVGLGCEISRSNELIGPGQSQLGRSRDLAPCS